MLANHNIGACLPTFRKRGDRYCLNGHGGGKTMQEMLDLTKKVKGLDGPKMVGDVRLVEYIELAYWLKRLDYKGWLTRGIFPYREDKVPAATHTMLRMDRGVFPGSGAYRDEGGRFKNIISCLQGACPLEDGQVRSPCY